MHEFMDSAAGEIAPMVNGNLMQRYTGRKVRCVVKVGERNPAGVMMGQTSDGQMVKILSQPDSVYSSKFVEIIGVVDMSGGAIQEQVAINFGTILIWAITISFVS